VPIKDTLLTKLESGSETGINIIKETKLIKPVTVYRTGKTYKEIV